MSNKFFYVVKVGTDDRPASNDEIAEATKKLEEFVEASGIEIDYFVTHHAIEFIRIEA